MYIESVAGKRVELEVYECDGCGFHIGFDSSYIDQVGDVSIQCPSCGEVVISSEEERYTLILDDTDNIEKVSKDRIVRYAINRVIANIDSGCEEVQMMFDSLSFFKARKAMIARLGGVEESIFDDDLCEIDDIVVSELFNILGFTMETILNASPLSFKESVEVIRYFDEDVVVKKDGKEVPV